jgi:hypothetical protein
MLTFFFPVAASHFQGTRPVMRLGIKTHLSWWDHVGCSARGIMATLIPHALESTLAGQTIVGGPLPGLRLDHTLLTLHSLAANFSSRLLRDGIHLPPPSATLLWRPSQLFGRYAELTSFFFGSTLKDLFVTEPDHSNRGISAFWVHLSWGARCGGRGMLSR